MESFEGQQSQTREGPEKIFDLEEARAYIEELFERGERPIVTVKQKRVDALKEGIPMHASWIPNVDTIAGTFGREAYLPEDEERVKVEISGIAPDQIEPRFTGPDKAFQGVVVLRGPIPPEAIRII